MSSYTQNDARHRRHLRIDRCRSSQNDERQKGSIRVLSPTLTAGLRTFARRRWHAPTTPTDSCATTQTYAGRRPTLTRTSQRQQCIGTNGAHRRQMSLRAFRIVAYLGAAEPRISAVDRNLDLSVQRTLTLTMDGYCGQRAPRTLLFECRGASLRRYTTHMRHVSWEDQWQIRSVRQACS